MPGGTNPAEMNLDAHCHLPEADVPSTPAEGPDPAPEVDPGPGPAGAKTVFLVNATRLSDLGRLKAVAGRDERLIPSVGCHPWFLGPAGVSDWSELEAALVGWAWGLGEVGLDRVRAGKGECPPMPVQVEALGAQLALAVRRRKPVSLHIVRAWDELFSLLKATGLPREEVPILVHDFQGPMERAKRCLDHGILLSFTLRHGGQRDLYPRLPRDRTLLETDGVVDATGAAIGKAYEAARGLTGLSDITDAGARALRVSFPP